MSEKDVEKHVPDPFDEIRSKGPIIVCIGDLIKSRPGAKAKPKARLSLEPDKQWRGFWVPLRGSPPEKIEGPIFVDNIRELVRPKRKTAPEPRKEED